MRLAQLLLWLAIVLAVLRPFLRRPSLGGGPPPPDALVKDPVCQTYVVRSRAIRSAGADASPYFCSVECARRWAAGTHV